MCCGTAANDRYILNPFELSVLPVTLLSRSVFYLRFTVSDSQLTCLRQALKRLYRSPNGAVLSIHRRTSTAVSAARGITGRSASNSPTTCARHGGVGWFTSATISKGSTLP